MKKLPLSFYESDDVVSIAKNLLGKILVTNWNDQFTSGRIVETEAYAGEFDLASHASKGRTPRTEVIFGPPGRAYIYLCYGIHQMFNIVTGSTGVPHAILIRAVEPMHGFDIMMKRMEKKETDAFITRGPGKVGRAFGFHTSQTGHRLNSKEIFLADDGFLLEQENIVADKRIGVDYAGEHALWPYRFYIKNNKFVSGRKLKAL